MRETRDERHSSVRVKALATKGLREPHQLTPEETRELCGAVMRQYERRKP